jgi:hypothetical protein
MHTNNTTNLQITNKSVGPYRDCSFPVSIEGNAIVRCVFGHVGDGLRADSSTRFPGADLVTACCVRILTQVWAESKHLYVPPFYTSKYAASLLGYPI